VIDFCGLELAHPVINGSGTFDALAARRCFGEQLIERFPFAAYVSKTITLARRAGNPPPRIWEMPAGMINSIGLPNRGLEAYLADDLPALAGLGVPVITNVMGSTADEFCELVAAVGSAAGVAAIELNVSCPNVRTGLDIGADPRELEALVERVRPLCDRPLIVKLTPNTADVGAAAVAAQSGGADAVSLINTLRALAIDPKRGLPWLGGGFGGLSGPAVRAVALAHVAAVASRVAIPIVGMGGVCTGRDAADLIAAGARLVAVGTESFRDPAAGARIARELADISSQSAGSTARPADRGSGRA